MLVLRVGSLHFADKRVVKKLDFTRHARLAIAAS